MNEASAARLKILFRVMGTASLGGWIFVVVPFAWMDGIHAALGMGPLTYQPIVDYLARSTSALYGILGGLMWVLSTDPVRYQTVIRYFGWAIAVMGVSLAVIDWNDAMPLAWKLWEGPFVTLLGLTIRFLGRRKPGEASPS